MIPSDADLFALLEKADKATPGPWDAWQPVRMNWHTRNVDVLEQRTNCAPAQDAHDAAFIAAANPSTVAALVRELLASRQATKDLRAEVAGLTAVIDADEGDKSVVAHLMHQIPDDLRQSADVLAFDPATAPPAMVTAAIVSAREGLERVLSGLAVVKRNARNARWQPAPDAKETP